MKRLFAMLLTAVFLCTFITAGAAPSEKESAEKGKGLHFEGYVIGDFAGSDTNKWVGFGSDSPSETETYTFSLPTYAAAYHGGKVYGYIYGYDSEGVLHDDFYYIDLKTRVHHYPDGASSGGEFVYAMAFNPHDGVMYALCDEDHPYIASVDLGTGELTPVISIALGNLLGVQTLAIDGEGNFYVLTFAAISSKLMKVNLSNGSLTELVSTGLPCFYAQSMTYEGSTNSIYWAHVNERTSSTNGLYRIGLSDYSIEYLGMIGEGMELMGLLAYDESELNSYLPGDVNNDGSVDSADALLVMRHCMELDSLEGAALEAADVNGNGLVGSDDALLIARYAMGLIEGF